MARLHLSELAEANDSYHDYCLCYIASIMNRKDDEVYVPISGVRLTETIPLRRIYFPLTTSNPEPVDIKGFTDNNYKLDRILSIKSDSEALIIKNFIFCNDGKYIRLVFGKYAVYKIDGDICVFKNRFVYLLDGQYFNRYKNTKLKNFLFQKFIPYYLGDGYFRFWEFTDSSYIIPKVNINMTFIERSIKDSCPKFNTNTSVYSLGYTSISNSVMLLNELSYICDEKSIKLTKSRIPNYMTKMSETEINSLSLPKIMVNAADL